VARKVRVSVSVPEKLKAYDLLEEGARRADVASEIGVSLPTIHAWARAWKGMSREEVSALLNGVVVRRAIPDRGNPAKNLIKAARKLVDEPETGKPDSEMSVEEINKEILHNIAISQLLISRGMRSDIESQAAGGARDIAPDSDSLISMKVFTEVQTKIVDMIPKLERMGQTGKKTLRRLAGYLEKYRRMSPQELAERTEELREIRKLHGHMSRK